MKRKIIVKTANLVDRKLMLHVNETISGLIPMEQILVDSEQFSFIYLMEDNEDYTYIVISEPIWPLLKEALGEKIPVWIMFNEETMELTNFLEELEYVISNIQGNSNYGEGMVAKVEKNF
jgi:hypothetical protein